MSAGTALRNLRYRWRGFITSTYLRLHGCKVGSGLKVRSKPIFRNIPKGNITIGNNVNLGFGCTLEVTPDGHLYIGDGVDLTHNVVLSSNRELRIGKGTLIAENVSVRDSSHGTAKGTPIARQSSVSEAVHVGEDVWLGANVVVLMGSQVPDGAIIGTQSLVNQKSELEPNGIYAGIPVKFIRWREEA